MRRLAPSLRGLAVAFLGAVVTFVVPVKADDVFWHLAVGERILTTGAIPRTNTFSFTAPEAPWLAHEWLSEVLFAWVHRLGPAALGLLGLGLEVAAFALLTALAWRGTRSPVASALLSLFAGLLWLANWSLRPYLFGNLLLLATLWLVDTAPGRARSLALAGLFALWANLHGSWLLGLGVLGAWALGATLRGEPTWRRRWGELLISTVATTLTPHHVHGLLFPFRYLESSVLEGPSFLAEIVEWQRVSPASPLGALLVVVVTLAIGLVAASRQRPRLERSLVFLPSPWRPSRRCGTSRCSAPPWWRCSRHTSPSSPDVPAAS